MPRTASVTFRVADRLHAVECVTVEPEIIACDLDQQDLQRRAADWATLAAHVRSKRRIRNGFRVVYDPGAAEALRSLVEAERICCSWATWTCETASEGEILQITGPLEPIDALAETFGV